MSSAQSPSNGAPIASPTAPPRSVPTTVERVGVMIYESQITATFTGPRQTSLFPKAARPAAPCATHCYHAFVVVVGPAGHY